MKTKNLINSVILFLGIVSIASGQKQNIQARPPAPPSFSFNLLSGSDRQTVCENIPVSTITYEITPSTPTSVIGLPSGVNWSFLFNRLTISGTPTNAGIYNYVVSTIDGSIQLPGVITVTAKTTPSFTQLAPINVGDTLAALPTTSTNGITGTWLPAPNNTATTTYTFTPFDGQCANTTAMTVAVNTTPTPTQNLCIRDTQSYSVNTTDSSHAGSTYAWSISPTIPNIIITGQGTNSITIDWSNAPYGSYTLQTVETNTAGCLSTPVNATINLTQPTAAPSAPATQTFCTAATVANLTATGTNLQWFTTATGGTALTATTALTTGNYYVSQTVGLCESNRTAVAVSVNPTLTPAFTQVAPICAGGILSTLPTTSNNGITGTWLPAINNTATTTYTFTPTANQCAETSTMTILVNPNVTPTFTQVAPICSGGILASLPTTSNNGITGTWLPAIINTATTAYTFTPTAGLCATTTAMTIVVNPSVTPTFTQVAPVCSGGILSPLPITSNNGITGTWLPAINNTETTTYTFTPTAGLCATTTAMTIVVNQNVTPTFTQVAPICSGGTLTALPTTSNNGITGTWLPAINPNITTTYIFTPTAGQCASTTTQTIIITAPVVTSPISFVAPAPVAALPSVTIGTQVWTNKNLDVTTYRDGTPIPQVTDPTAWANLTTGAWCYYNNDPANGAIYGKLYNWYAVAGIYDAASLGNPSLRKKLAPTGWHVPTDGEWTTLTDFLGGGTFAGGKMKLLGTSLWQTPNAGATNSSGFKGIPGGWRYANFGAFEHIGAYGLWWSSSEVDTIKAVGRLLSYNFGAAIYYDEQKTLGFSVRCLRD